MLEIVGLRAVNPDDESDFKQGQPCEIVEVCPICDGRMETVYSRNNQKVCVCVDCHSGLTVPDAAWEVARVKRVDLDLSDGSPEELVNSRVVAL